ncbi:MAG: AAA family ATPase [Bauldia sp.]|nr:AAA family ATPase [Bauldia sp.]MCW5717054.1 AAA family ATPase [Bauldia sp.]
MPNAAHVLGLLAERRNVIISGPPGTGKSLLLSAIADQFEQVARAGAAAFEPRPGIPARARTVPPLALPTPMQVAHRKVFRTVMHQSSKHRDFLTGVMPDLRPRAPAGAVGALPATEAPNAFRIIKGVLYRASEYARLPDHAALLIIDEINRGPAVQVFGGAIVAIEGEKRLADDGSRRPATQFFELLDPVSGDIVEYALPSRLYILAAMNQADVSVEPLDVAFLRRWMPVRLEPSAQALREHFRLGPPADLPSEATQSQHIYEAAVKAFEAINARILLGRGPEFQIGHGVFMHPSGNSPTSLDEAKTHLATAWTLVRNHVEEAFFGDVRGTAIVLNAGQGVQNHPLALEEDTFGESPRILLVGPRTTAPDGIYAMLRAVAAKPTA